MNKPKAGGKNKAPADPPQKVSKPPLPQDDTPRRDDDDLSALLRSANPEQKRKR